MDKKLEIDEEVIMFKMIFKENGNIDYLKTFVENSYKFVKVKKCDNVLGNEIYTVVDSNGDEYCAPHRYNKEYGNNCLVTRKEYINALKKGTSKLWYNSDYVKKLLHRINMVCDHLFVKLREGYTVPGFHSSDYEYQDAQIYCVHCGLTNWWSGINISYETRSMRLVSEAYNDYIRTFCPANVRYYRGDTSFIPFISQEAYCFLKPEERYLEAKKLKPDADNEEIFQTMKQLENEEIEEIKRKIKMISEK